jgi:hypothetical protein
MNILYGYKIIQNLMLISNLFKKLHTKEFTEKVGGPRTSADKADKTKR